MTQKWKNSDATTARKKLRATSVCAMERKQRRPAFPGLVPPPLHLPAAAAAAASSMRLRIAWTSVILKGLFRKRSVPASWHCCATCSLPFAVSAAIGSL